MIIERNNMPDGSSPDINPQVPSVHTEPVQPRGLLARLPVINSIFHREPGVQVLVKPGEAQPTRQIKPVTPERQEIARKAWEAQGKELTPDHERMIQEGIAPMEGGATVAVGATWENDFGVTEWQNLPKNSEEERQKRYDVLSKYAPAALKAVRIYHSQERKMLGATPELDVVEKEKIARKNRVACEILNEVAVQDKRVGLDAKIALVQQEFYDRDIEFASHITDPDPIIQAEKRNDFYKKIDLLEKLRLEQVFLDRFKAGDPNVPRHAQISEERWEEMKKRAGTDGVAKDIADAVQNIALIDPNYLAGRDALQAEMRAEVVAITNAIVAEDNKKEDEIKGRPYDKEKSVEEAFLSKYELVTVDSYEQAVLANNEELKSWYILKARSLGIFKDLDEDLQESFDSIVTSLNPEMVRGGGRLAAQRQLLEQQETFPPIVERGISWNPVIAKLQRSGLPVDQIEKFRGVRQDFMISAYEHMSSALFNLTHKDEQVDIETMPGEWDANKALDLEESNLFYEISTFGTITLTGRNFEEIRLGVENYLDSLLRVTNTFDAQTIQTAERSIATAVEAKRAVIQKSGNFTVEEADKEIAEISMFTKNRINLAMLDILNLHLRSGEFGGYYAQIAEFKGVDRLKNLLRMNKGKIGFAICEFLDPENRLIFEPHGFKGSLAAKGTTQSYNKDRMIEQIVEKTMEYEVIDPKLVSEDELKKVKSMEEYRLLFRRKAVTPQEALKEAQDVYGNLLEAAELAHQNNYLSTVAELREIQKARIKLTKAMAEYIKAQREAKNVVDTAFSALTNNGESAHLGAAVIIAENGDYVNFNENILFLKGVIMEAAKVHQKVTINGQDYYVEDSMGMMTYRAWQWMNTRSWITDDQWKKDQEQQVKAGKMKREDMHDRRTFLIRTVGPDGVEIKVEFKLQKGWEDTGFTEKEWEYQQDAVAAVRKDGYGAKIKIGDNDFTFAGMVKRNDVQPILNAYIAQYRSSRDLVNNPVVIRETRQGNEPWVESFFDRMEATGRIRFLPREGLRGLNGELLGEQERLNLFHEAVTDSTFLHYTVHELSLWHATRSTETKTADGKVEDSFDKSRYSAKSLYFGQQGLGWGLTRLQKLGPYMFTNENQEIARGVNLVPFVPVHLYSLSQEMGFSNLVEAILNLDKEAVDDWSLMTFGFRIQDVNFTKTALEGSIDGREEKRQWGFLQKLLSDANALLELFNSREISVKRILNDPELLTEAQKEKMVDSLMERMARFGPIDTAAENAVANNRGATGSGIGMLVTARWFQKYYQWLILKTPADWDRREAGGLVVQSDLTEIIQLITKENSFSPGVSILKETIRKLTSTHNKGKIDQPKLRIRPAA